MIRILDLFRFSRVTLGLQRRARRGHLCFCGPCALGIIGIVSSAGCSRDAPPDQPSVAAAGLGSQDPSVSDPPRAEPRPSGTLPAFRMIGPESGLDFERNDDIHGLHRIIEANGGGVALFDSDRDGLLDVFLTNGCRLPLESGDRDSPSALFRNLGQLRFARVTDPSRIAQFGYAHGCAIGDYDADGFEDLYVTALGRNTFWRNNGDGTFTDVTEQTGTAVSSWSSSAALADLDLDGHLDLYVVNYLEESGASPTLCPNPNSPDGYVSCPPSQFDGVDDVLFLADGAGGFLDHTAQSGIAGLRGKGLGVVTADFDGDFRPEIYVANDGEANFLFVRSDAPASESDVERPSEPPLRYEERALFSGVALDEAGYAEASMGIAAGDFNADGATDLFLTHFTDETNTLYANRGAMQFEESTRQSRLAASRHALGFGTVFFDPDNDGWLDLFVANGYVEDRGWTGEPYRMRAMLYRNERDSSFADVSSFSGEYFVREWLGRGAACGDVDRDGRIDLAVSHQLSPSLLLRNETETDNAFLVLRLIGAASPRSGIGARVELPGRGIVVRELYGGGSFQSSSAPEVHLGLDSEQAAAVRITWPSGRVDTLNGLAAGRWSVVEGGRAVRLPSGTGQD